MDKYQRDQTIGQLSYGGDLMLNFSRLAPMILAGITCLVISNAQAEVTQIITPVPAPKETAVIPPGYSGCITVGSGWYKGVWYPEHRVCQYDPQITQAAQGDAYVEGHWA